MIRLVFIYIYRLPSRLRVLYSHVTDALHRALSISTDIYIAGNTSNCCHTGNLELYLPYQPAIGKDRQRSMSCVNNQLHGYFTSHLRLGVQHAVIERPLALTEMMLSSAHGHAAHGHAALSLSSAKAMTS